MPFTIRDFQPADFDTLWRIDQTCFPKGIAYSRAELKLYIRRPESFTLIAVGGEGENGGRGEDQNEDQNEGQGRARDDGQGQISKTDHSAGPLISTNGVAGFIVAEKERGAGHIITIDVVASARRFGVGSLLLRSSEERLRAARCTSVELETSVDNVSALSFYKRHGYSVTGTFPRYYSNGVDALVLEKALSVK